MFLQLNCSFPVSGGHAWLLGEGGMCGCQGREGAYVVAGGGGHAWLLGGMHGCWGAYVVARGHVWFLGGCAWLPEGHAWLLGGCMPCDLSHHAFDVTCMLSLLQLRLNRNAATYIVLVMWHAHPPRQNCWHTLLKILPCPNFVAGGNYGKIQSNKYVIPWIYFVSHPTSSVQ